MGYTYDFNMSLILEACNPFFSKNQLAPPQKTRQPESGSVEWRLKENPMFKATIYPKRLFPPYNHGIRNRREYDATPEKFVLCGGLLTKNKATRRENDKMCGLTRMPAIDAEDGQVDGTASGKGF